MPSGGVLLVAVLCAPPAHPILSEVLYDAVGDDTGQEFVELFNPTVAAYPLAGARLEAGDGAGPGRWSLRWTGLPRDTIAPGGRFVIGGARVQPPPQALAALDLQNGPDAVRIVWPDGAIETLGYGALEFPEYACGTPAADAPSGQSLARLPDDANLGSNALDFQAAAPSPGRPNRSERDLGWRPGSLALDPPQPRPREAARLGGTVVNHGRASIGPGEASVSVRAAGSFGERLVARSPLAAAIAPGESAGVTIALDELPDGKQTLSARCELPGDEAPVNDVDSALVRVGPGPLEITEVQFHPASGEGEWVEVRNRSAAPLDLGGFTLSDRGAGRGSPPTGAICAPESLALLAQSRRALLVRHPELDSTRVWPVAPWAALNNSDDASHIADQVVLRERDGTPCDRIDYSAAGVPAGVPLERGEGGVWGPDSDPGGTPLRPPRALPPVPERLRVTPRRVRAGEDLRIAWSLPWPRGRIAVDAFDLGGRMVRRVLPELAVGTRGERALAMSGVPAGLCVLALRARSESGGETLVATRLVRIDRAER